MTPKNVIEVLASRFASKFPVESITSREDLISEGWIIHYSIKDRFREYGKVKYTTYLWNQISFHFRKMVKREFNKAGINIDYSECNIINYITPERLAELNQALRAVARVSNDLADLIANGASGDFITAIKRDNRIKVGESRCRKAINSKICPSKKFIENYFAVDMKFMAELVYNYL